MLRFALLLVMMAAAALGAQLPTPKAQPATIRFAAVPDSLSIDGVPYIVSSSHAAFQVSFRGSNFVNDSSLMSVWFGPNSNITQYACTLVPAQTSNSTLTCTTPAGADGVNLAFVVAVRNQTALALGITGTGALSNSSIPVPNWLNAQYVWTRGTDVLSYQSVPIVTSISGCNPVIGCGTDGSDVVTIHGTNFAQPIAVLIAGQICSNPVVLTSHRVTCHVPAGAGTGLYVTVSSCGGVMSAPVPIFDYALPVINSIEGCNPLYPYAGNEIYKVIGCSRYGGEVITFHGRNFGFSGAKISVGANPCTHVTHMPGAENTNVTCVTPAGTNNNLPVTFVQAGGGTSPSRILVTYANCPAGTASIGIECLNCTIGYFQSSRGKLSCNPCEPGRFTADNGTVQCDYCFNGYYQTGTASTSCLECPPGSYSTNASTGATTCQNCPTGTFTNAAGSPYCVDCVDPDSLPDEHHINCVCGIGFYGSVQSQSFGVRLAGGDEMIQDVTICHACNSKSMICDQIGMSLEIVRAADGWWRSSNVTTDFQLCLDPAHCQSGKCADRRTGPLCALCQPNYSGTDCIECPSDTSTTVARSIGISVLLFGCLAIIMVVMLRSDTGAEDDDTLAISTLQRRRQQNLLFSVVKSYTTEDRVAPSFVYNLKTFISFLQIATAVSAQVDLPLPSYFQQFINAFSFISVDFIPWQAVECVPSYNFFTRLTAYFVVPLCLIVVVGVLPRVYLWLRNRFDYRDSSVRREIRIRQGWKVTKLVVFIVFLLYPRVSQVMLSYFVCVQVASHENAGGNPTDDTTAVSYLLEADMRVTCYDARWHAWLPLVVFGIIIYIAGVPLILLGIFVWNRSSLHSSPQLRHSFGLVYDAYTKKWYFFELADLCMKLVLSSLLPFVHAPWTAPVGMIFCTVHVMVLLIAAPFLRASDDAMCVLSYTHIFLILLMSFVLSTVADGSGYAFTKGSVNDVLTSAVMILVFVVLATLLAYCCIVYLRKRVRSVQRAKRAREPKIGDPGDGSARPNSDDTAAGAADSNGKPVRAKTIHQSAISLEITTTPTSGDSRASTTAAAATTPTAGSSAATRVSTAAADAGLAPHRAATLRAAALEDDILVGSEEDNSDDDGLFHRMSIRVHRTIPSVAPPPPPLPPDVHPVGRDRISMPNARRHHSQYAAGFDADAHPRPKMHIPTRAHTANVMTGVELVESSNSAASAAAASPRGVSFAPTTRPAAESVAPPPPPVAE